MGTTARRSRTAAASAITLALLVAGSGTALADDPGTAPRDRSP